MDTTQKLIEAKRSWAIWNLLDELQERLWLRYEDEFLEFTRRRYNPPTHNQTHKKILTK